MKLNYEHKLKNVILANLMLLEAQKLSDDNKSTEIEFFKHNLKNCIRDLLSHKNVVDYARF